MVKVQTIVALLFLSSCVTPFANEEEFAYIQESPIKYKDWTFKDWSTGQPMTLSMLIKGKKLVMVTYFAPWCSNWKHELPLVRKLYEKYKSQGFEVIGVSEYAPAADIKDVFAPEGVPFPVVVESESRSERNKTTHYDYRRSCNDNRKWGSPWHIFIEPAALTHDDRYLMRKAWVGNGEFYEQDAEKFISERLAR